MINIGEGKDRPDIAVHSPSPLSADDAAVRQLGIPRIYFGILQTESIRTLQKGKRRLGGFF
jgi:hypothetical protein